MKLVYQKPTIEIHHVEMETHLLNYSTTTGDPTEGGDPTGGEGDSYPNPFGATPAKKTCGEAVKMRRMQHGKILQKNDVKQRKQDEDDVYAQLNIL